MRSEAPHQQGTKIPPSPDIGSSRNPGKRRWLGLLLALLVLASVGAFIAIRNRDATEAPPSATPMDIESIPGSLAFLVQDGATGDTDIHVRSHEGAETVVTSGPEFDLGSVLSPDGARIAFARDEDAELRTRRDIDIWLVQVDGSGEQRQGHHCWCWHEPATVLPLTDSFIECVQAHSLETEPLAPYTYGMYDTQTLTVCMCFCWHLQEQLTWKNFSTRWR
jgi:hypothetical protein